MREALFNPSTSQPCASWRASDPASSSAASGAPESIARFPDKSEPTLAMALGGTGLTLEELTQLYASLARGGDSITLTHRY